MFMSNHIHLLLTPTKDNMGDAMCYLVTNLSKYLNYKNNRVNHNFGGSYSSTIINNEKHLINVIRYIYQNPVNANIVADTTQYPYSSLGTYLGTNNPRIIIEPDSLTKTMFSSGLNGIYQWLDWVCKTLTDVDIEILKKSLTRGHFKYSIEQLKLVASSSTTIQI
jgi:hypothetical protein